MLPRAVGLVLGLGLPGALLRRLLGVVLVGVPPAVGLRLGLGLFLGLCLVGVAVAGLAGLAAEPAAAPPPPPPHAERGFE